MQKKHIVQSNNSGDVVAVAILNLSSNRLFEYLIPEEFVGKIYPGCRVVVPFGKASEAKTAFAVEIHASSEYPREKLKNILGLEAAKEQIPENLLKLARWISDYYCAPYDQALMTLLPAVVRNGKVRKKEQNFVRLCEGVNAREVAATLEKRFPKQANVLYTLERLGSIAVRQLCSHLGITNSVIESLKAKGLVDVEMETVERRAHADLEIIPSSPLELTADQKKIMPELLNAIDAEKGGVFLLHGVTGSGKTEVFLQAIARCLELGKQAIVLVPEISLTPQTTERFRSRFGDMVSVLHSSLSNGQRFDEWIRLQRGDAKIAVGARSALFAPLNNVGLIIVDEEHEGSYKQDESPHYHARDVAVVRGKMENAVVLLGSATPSFESFYNCQIGKYKLLTLPNRYDGQAMPYVEIVDMRNEANGLFSRRLEEAVHTHLHQGEQVILFLNRRGYATQFLCKTCGYIASCEECEQAFTYHRKVEQLCCHSCGKVIPAPSVCPLCGHEAVAYTGVGTEKVEAVAHVLFPEARIVRMDADTTTGKGAHEKLLNEFRSGKANLLIGTQMIAKGHHFPNVTLVGVINADKGLHLPDFRAAERTFSLITQVAGRAGRGGIPGEVIVQSYTADHLALLYAKQHDFLSFYEEEIIERKMLSLPPVARMILIRFFGKNRETVALIAEQFAEAMKSYVGPTIKGGKVIVSAIEKSRENYRYQVMYRGEGVLQLLPKIRAMLMGKRGMRGVSVSIDVDPQNVM